MNGLLRAACTSLDARLQTGSAGWQDDIKVIMAETSRSLNTWTYMEGWWDAARMSLPDSAVCMARDYAAVVNRQNKIDREVDECNSKKRKLFEANREVAKAKAELMLISPVPDGR